MELCLIPRLLVLALLFSRKQHVTTSPAFDTTQNLLTPQALFLDILDMYYLTLSAPTLQSRRALCSISLFEANESLWQRLQICANVRSFFLP